MKFGRLIIIRDVTQKGPKMVECLCSCGATITTQFRSLKNGRTKSCGCYGRDETRRRNAERTKHGCARAKNNTPEYRAWNAMMTRCRNPKGIYYKNYGGRGITVCCRWNDFTNFLADMGQKPTSSHSLDRIDNDGDYEPLNCRWTDRKTQSRNNRRNRIVEWQGELITFVELAEKTGVSYNLLRDRIVEWGWPIAEAVRTPKVGNRHGRANFAKQIEPQFFKVGGAK